MRGDDFLHIGDAFAAESLHRFLAAPSRQALLLAPVCKPRNPLWLPVNNWGAAEQATGLRPQACA